MRQEEKSSILKSQSGTQKVHLSSQYLSHMVVLGKALTRPLGWVRMVTVCVYSAPYSRTFLI